MKVKYNILFKTWCRFAPIITSIILFVFSFVIKPVLNVQITLSLIPIFFWGSEKNISFDFIFVIILGIFQDIVDGTLLGINIFLFLSLYFFVFYQKLISLESSFIISYIAFIISSFSILIVKYFIIWILINNVISISNLLLSWMFLILCYPFVYLILQKINLKIMKVYNNA